MTKWCLVLSALLGALACNRGESEPSPSDLDASQFEHMHQRGTPAGQPAQPGRGEGERESLDPSVTPSTMPPPEVEPTKPYEEAVDPYEHSGHD